MWVDETSSLRAVNPKGTLRLETKKGRQPQKVAALRPHVNQVGALHRPRPPCLRLLGVSRLAEEVCGRYLELSHRLMSSWSRIGHGKRAHPRPQQRRPRPSSALAHHRRPRPSSCSAI